MKFARFFTVFALVAGAATVLQGCQPKAATAPGQPTLESVAVAPKTVTLSPSGTQALKVTGTFSDNSTLDLTSAAAFSSDNVAVATVSGAGVITAVAAGSLTAPGTAHILATVNGKSDTATVTVTPPGLVSIAVQPAQLSLAVGATQDLSVIGTYNQGATAALTTGETFASDHTNVATVDASGKVTAVGAGTATITVTDTASGLTATASVTVAAPPPAAKLVSIAVTPTSIALAAGGTQQLTVTGKYSDGTQLQLAASAESFVSSAPAVATVSAAGLVTAVATGTATITVVDTASGLVAATSPTVTVSTTTVAPTLVSIALSPLTATLAPGATQQLTVIGTYSDKSTKTLPASGETFTSLATGVATVSATGLVTVAAGAANGATATITAKDVASGVATTTATSTVITVSAPATTNVLSTGFNSNGTTTTSVSGQTGTWAAYFGGKNNPAGGSGGGYADANPPANPSYEYVYVQDTAANLAGYTYQGITITAATGQTVSASGYNALSFTMGVNPEWFSSGPANFVVILTSNVPGVSTGASGNPANCNPKVAAVVTAKASASTAYSVPLTAFTNVVQNCGNASVTPTQILAAPIVSVDFQADGGTAAITASGLTSTTNTTVPLSSNATLYPTTISVAGGVSFASTSTAPATTNVLSTGFNAAGTTTTSVSGQTGTWAAYFGGKNNPAGGSGGGYADANPPANPSYEYVYVQDTAANLAGYTYQGITITAATGQTVAAGSNQHLNFTMGVNPEWFSSGPANFVVILTSNVPGVSTGASGNPANCNPKVAAVVTATASASTAYSVPLTAFTNVVQNCGNASVTPTQILAAPIVSVDFQADGGTAAITASGLTSTTNTTVPLSSNATLYPTTISVASGVSFAP